MLVLLCGAAVVFLLVGAGPLQIVLSLLTPWSGGRLGGGLSLVALDLAAFVALLVIGIVAAAKRDEAATRAPVTSAFAGPSWSSDAQVPQEAVHRSADRTNGLAIAALIVVFFSSVVGVILGHVALSQIKRTGEGGRGLALAAVVIGWVSIGIVVIALLVVVGLTVAHSGGS